MCVCVCVAKGLKRFNMNSMLWGLWLPLPLIVLLLTPRVYSTWWYMGALGTQVVCDNIPGLVSRQRQLCHKYPEAMQSIGVGAKEWIAECQHQFRHHRWNCITLDRDHSLFGRVMLRSSREAAFVYAISSAGVVFAITRACSQGELGSCSCDPKKKGSSKDSKGTFDWGGCSDNINYGIRFGKAFVDAKEKKGKDARALMNLHNNRAVLSSHTGFVGRIDLLEGNGCLIAVVDLPSTTVNFTFHPLDEQCLLLPRGRNCFTSLGGADAENPGGNNMALAVKRFLQLECKCHGVSGSCTLRTCWLAMQDFQKTGNYLRRKYNGAIQVIMNQDGTGFTIANKNFKKPTKNDLVYFENSPDYCVVDRETGSLGTAGRVCNRTSRGMDGCEVMCCGRGYDTTRVMRVTKCECKFHWCCVVRCKECHQMTDVHTCKAPKSIDWLERT